VIVYAVVDDALSPDFPLGDALDVFVRREDACPKDKVSLTHGNPGYHWARDGFGALCIDLESMWADFEHAVDKLIAALGNDDARRAIVLQRWRERT